MNRQQLDRAKNSEESRSLSHARISVVNECRRRSGDTGLVVVTACDRDLGFPEFQTPDTGALGLDSRLPPTSMNPPLLSLTPSAQLPQPLSTSATPAARPLRRC